MPLIELEGIRPVLMGDMRVSVTDGADGIKYVRSITALTDVPDTMVAVLDRWADERPDHVFLADRLPNGGWHTVTYAETRRHARSIAAHLLAAGLSVDHPLLILSGNSVNHGLLALGAMTAGIPYAPIAPAYSTAGHDFARVRHVVSLLTPGMVFADHLELFAEAIAATIPPETPVIGTGDLSVLPRALPFAELLGPSDEGAVDKAIAGLGPDTIAKFLFTSGSTGMPKAVINTQRMLCGNQVMIREALAFLKHEPPVLCDWLPWNHTAGGNHNFGIALMNGGTLYIDGGAPSPKGIFKTVHNLLDIAPTLYFNVPKGFEMLVEHLEANDALREKFFSRVNILQYAGASLAKHVWDALEALAIRTIGKKVMIITGYGSTETAPFASTTTWPVGRPGEIGLPATGLEMKLVPNGVKLELRLRGPSITPGYWRQPAKTAESFDEEGFYKIGDALKFVDPADPMKGLLFDGRVSEDFKLDTGTWVNMAAVRAATITGLAPLVRDLVLTGLDSPHIGALLFLDLDACRRIFPELAGIEDEAAIARHPPLVDRIRQGLDGLARKSTGSSTLVARAIIMEAGPNPLDGEMTDKGSINQRAVIARRESLVADLYTDPVPAHVLVARRK